MLGKPLFLLPTRAPQNGVRAPRNLSGVPGMFTRNLKPVSSTKSDSRLLEWQALGNRDLRTLQAVEHQLVGREPADRGDVGGEALDLHH